MTDQHTVRKIFYDFVLFSHHRLQNLVRHEVLLRLINNEVEEYAATRPIHKLDNNGKFEKNFEVELDFCEDCYCVNDVVQNDQIVVGRGKNKKYEYTH